MSNLPWGKKLTVEEKQPSMELGKSPSVDLGAQTLSGLSSVAVSSLHAA